MPVTSYGFARPLKFNDLEKGMLVLAAPTVDQRYFGVVTKFRHDFILVTLSASDGGTPGALNLANHSGDLWFVPGILEIEPAAAPFSRGPASAPFEGLMIDGNGHLLAAFLHRNEVGQKERFVIDLTTGDHSREEARHLHAGIRLFIRQDGRRERFDLPA